MTPDLDRRISWAWFRETVARVPGGMIRSTACQVCGRELWNYYCKPGEYPFTRMCADCFDAKHQPKETTNGK